MVNKHLYLIFILVSIISFIISLNMFSKERIVFNVNYENRSFFKESVKNDDISDIDSITKVELGQGWHSGELYIHHSFGKTEKIIITEGNFKFTNLQRYVKEYGHNLDNYAKILFIISIVSLIISIVLFKHK